VLRVPLRLVDETADAPAPSAPPRQEEVRRTLAAHASERVDAASTALLGATLAMIAAAAMALASLHGEHGLTAIAAALCGGAAVVLTTVRRRIARELQVVAEANGLPPDVARAEVAAVLAHALRLD
jgi:hypothetical protein